MNKILEKLNLKKTREEVKQHLIKGIVSSITKNFEYNFTHTEQSEILEEIRFQVLEGKKELRTELLKEAREVQNILTDKN